MADASSPSSTSTYTPFTITSFPRIPLTTTFTRSNSDCAGVYLPTSSNIFLIQDQLSCLPSGFNTAERSFFSPGIACPSGYWSACHDNTGVSSITTVTCCPTYDADVSLSCLNPATLDGPWKSKFCTWIAGTQTKAIPVTESGGGRTSTVTRTMSGVQGINAYGVRMVYQATDLPSSSTAAAGSSGTGSSSSATPPAGSPISPSPAAESSSPSSGLSTGAAVGIGVAIPVVVLGLLAALFMLWRKRRRERAADISPGAAAGAYSDTATSQTKPDTHFYGGPPVYSEQQRAPSELATTQHAAEMSTTQMAVELPAEGRPGRQAYGHGP
ncbi:hypothetical protein QBC47DRAFT_166086 [Echria macrotheca]|uniref:Uncharacterized protein n=1 Tax=Echria macrotheca TaxID=438768 RepID=A0AAJ0BGL7_9PEZI|nr:hypothetical protein QBC47DRAFT_166086 [Echria macrotheca]